MPKRGKTLLLQTQRTKQMEQEPRENHHGDLDRSVNQHCRVAPYLIRCRAVESLTQHLLCLPVAITDGMTLQNRSCNLSGMPTGGVTAKTTLGASGVRHLDALAEFTIGVDTAMRLKNGVQIDSETVEVELNTTTMKVGVYLWVDSSAT